MANIILEPEGLQEEITNSRTTNETIKDLKYDIDKMNVQLESIDKFIECLWELNAAILKFSEISEVDLNTLEIIRAQWMSLDEELASKTFFDLLIE